VEERRDVLFPDREAEFSTSRDELFIESQPEVDDGTDALGGNGRVVGTISVLSVKGKR
jgi:hypothetical protein